MLRHVLAPGLPLLFSLGALAQTPALPADQARVACLYQLTYQPDSTAPATRTELLRLLVGSQLSRFDSRAQLFRDSVMAATLTKLEQTKAQGEVPTIDFSGIPRGKMSTEFSETIYKVPTSGQVVVFDKISLAPYYYQEPTGPPAWTLTPATATIAGYSCQQATTTLGGRRWQAWFTRAVPLPEGPYKFYGLPGLIVQVSDTRKHFTYELVQLRQLPTPQLIELPKPGAKLLTKEALWKGKADYKRSAAAQLVANGNIRFTSPEAEEDFHRRARERANRKPNPLELQ